MAICGIAVNSGSRPVDRPTIDAMVSALAVESTWFREGAAEPEVGFGTTTPRESGRIWKSEDRKSVV